ncbi:homeodomain transcription factor [Roridomyces roridus]|uniref:Homeodomain transcription factor n=1 Tax=Roridomyces roridus TaxID=1738132 RepID=A0AAD7B5U9_9AGAR|nr:homeodomain transcription factor [Roridomyces roridus]
MPPLKAPLDHLKKPRHRHSAVQLAALNNLFADTGGHPSLNQRTELAHTLGLETKSVNAYFQNKRASSKKQPRGTPYDPPARIHLPPIDDDYHYRPDGYFRPQAPPLLDQDPRSRNHSPFDDRSRWRLSPIHVKELQRIYRTNPYPSIAETKALAEQLATHHQIITDWFQAERTFDRRTDYPNERITLPPISSLPLPPGSSHPSLTGVRRPDAYIYPSRRSPSPRNDVPAASTSQYSSMSSAALSLSSRQRRGRPDPFQLNSLRGLLNQTPTPSIEQRSALAREIGMDLGKVTNWFRNLRQSARKRARGHGGTMTAGSFSDDEHHDGVGTVYLSSPSRSRSETPAAPEECERDPRGRGRVFHSSDDDDESEAVTPSSSPPLSPNELVVDHRDRDNTKGQGHLTSVPYEDALLLLGFHRHAGVF